MGHIIHKTSFVRTEVLCTVDRNIEVIDHTGKEVFRLPQTVTWPDTKLHLVVSVDEEDQTKLVLKLKDPKTHVEDEQLLEDCSNLRRYSKWRKGKKGCKHAPHRYPATPEQNYRKPHRISESDLKYIQYIPLNSIISLTMSFLTGT